MSTATRTHAFLDRLEGETAVLILDDTPLELPRRLLPPGAREGDWIRVSLEIDAEETRRRADVVRARRERLGQGDDGGDFSL